MTALIAALRLRSRLPGLLVAGAGVAAAFLINHVLPALSPLTIAVILGVVLGNCGLRLAALDDGLKFAAKKLLRAGIVLLGLKLAAGDVLQLGGRGLAVVIAVVTITFFGTQLIGRWLGVSKDASLLMATGFSICGASAVAAMNGVTKSRDEDVVTAIALVTLCGSLAIAVLPLLQGPLGLSDEAFGMWTGASVHDVAQVVATASVVGPAALAPAVVVKLTRVVLLAPLVASVSLVQRARSRSGGADAGGKRPPTLPLFVALFLVMIAVRTTGVLPESWLEVGARAEEILLALALFALGRSVRIARLFTTGGRSLVLGLTSWVLIAAVAYGGVLLVAG